MIERTTTCPSIITGSCAILSTPMIATSGALMTGVLTMRR